MLNLEFVNGQNPWWTNFRLIEDDEKVKIALSHKHIREYEFPDENLIILGERQVGKTTFIKLEIRDLLIKKGVDPKNILFFSCETLSGKEDVIELSAYFDELSNSESKKYIFLDEITFVKDWNIGLLGLFNSGYMKNKQIWVTGSSSVSLQKETLPGRNIRKMNFYPLSFFEYVRLFHGSISSQKVDIKDIKGFHSAALKLMPHLKELNNMLESYSFVTGGLLSASYRFFETKDDPFGYYYDVYKDAVLSDLSRLGLSERIFRETLYGIFMNYGSAYSANSISKVTSIGSHKTVELYVDLMSKLFVLNTIFKKQNGRIMYRSNKKSYISDPFIYRVLKFYAAGARSISEKERPSIVEGIVGTALIRRYGDMVNYLRTKEGREVDFLIDGIGVEVKYGRAETGDLNTKKGYIVTRKTDIKIDGDKLLLPVSIFLYLLGLGVE